MTLELKTLAVAAIQNGTVIDHIDAGHALKIVKLLKLASHMNQVSIGLNLPSYAISVKDIIKVEELELSPKEVNQVAIFAPHATISIIKNYEILKKFKLSIPKTIEGVLCCPNPDCISGFEKTKKEFIVERKVKSKIYLLCRYCKKKFSQDEMIS